MKVDTSFPFKANLNWQNKIQHEIGKLSLQQPQTTRNQIPDTKNPTGSYPQPSKNREKGGVAILHASSRPLKTAWWYSSILSFSRNINTILSFQCKPETKEFHMIIVSIHPLDIYLLRKHICFLWRGKIYVFFGYIIELETFVYTYI